MNLTAVFTRSAQDVKLSTKEVVCLLNLEGEELAELYKQANLVRQNNMGDEVYLRGILEVSNYCKKSCNYCGIRSKTKNITRYRMPKEEILQACKDMEKNGMTTVVIQAGEDSFLSKDYIGEILQEIKKETNLAITLSLGDQTKETLIHWKECGMDRYLIRYESSEPVLFEKAHPDDDLTTRLAFIKTLQEIGIQAGSGFLIGIPGQTLEGLAKEILFCTSLNLDMIGIGPFIPHPDTPFGETTNPFEKEVFFKVISIIRLLNPKAHIPSTTAFDAIQPNGRNLLLQRGANVFMPNATPQKYRKFYQLYPNKPCVDESGEDCAKCVKGRIISIGRKIGTGKGHSLK